MLFERLVQAVKHQFIFPIDHLVSKLHTLYSWNALQKLPFIQSYFKCQCGEDHLALSCSIQNC